MRRNKKQRAMKLKSSNDVYKFKNSDDLFDNN